MMSRLHSLVLLPALCVALAVGCARPAFAARDAAFLDPGTQMNSSDRSPEAIGVEPKNDVDVGDTPANTGRRATFFFVNHTTVAVTVESMVANGDSNVKAAIVADDCSRQKRIEPGDRCSVTVEVTPIGVGSWAAELLMTHNSAGRISRARIMGRTNSSSVEKRDAGLSLNTKESKSVDFGDVDVGTGKAVRTALMVNDSSDLISILSIEVIAADNGLQRLDQGCEPDMDLKPGESCPVTLVWKPEQKSNVSTDLIIRHTGRLGFAVIPLRGVAKEEVAKGSSGPASSGPSATGAPNPGSTTRIPGVPQPPSVSDLTQLVDASNIPPISEQDLPHSALERPKKASEADKVSLTDYHLIGTVGNRAVIYKPDGSTAIVALGDAIESVGDKTIKLVNITPKEAEIYFDGKKVKLVLESVDALTRRAREARKNEPPRQLDLSKAGSSKSKAEGGDASSVTLPVGKK